MNKSYKTDRIYNETDRTNKTYGVGLIPKHGGYKKLESYKNTAIIRQGTEVFTKRWIKSFKQSDQMNGAARSGKQNIVEGSMISGTSKKGELKLFGTSRGSLEELLEDYMDFLVDRGLTVWGKDDPRATAVRKLAYRKDRTYKTYKTYIESDDEEEAANCLICLIHQTNFLLDQQLRALEKRFLEEGGFTERLYRQRVARRGRTNPE